MTTKEEVASLCGAVGEMVDEIERLRAAHDSAMQTIDELSHECVDLLTACKAVLAWADRECMPHGGRYDGPWEMVEKAIAKAEGRP